MALLQFDPRRMSLEIKVGVLEEYKPDVEIKRIHKRLDKIRTEAEKKLAKIAGENKSMQEQMQFIQENEAAEKKWQSYVQGEFAPELNKLVERIEKKNEKICPGFKERTQSNQKE